MRWNVAGRGRNLGYQIALQGVKHKFLEFERGGLINSGIRLCAGSEGRFVRLYGISKFRAYARSEHSS